MIPDQEDYSSLDGWYMDLTKIILEGRKDSNEAFNAIIEQMKNKIYHICHGFYISGYDFDDIFQEALFALRFKAIRDFNADLGDRASLSFENFACLCIKRHLSTILKVSSKNKQLTLNIACSLNQAVPISEDGVTKTTLMNFVSDEVVNHSLSTEDKLDIAFLFECLHESLSVKERKVLYLYAKKYTYKEISSLLTEINSRSGVNKEINIKSEDNAITRIRQKAKSVSEELK